MYYAIILDMKKKGNLIEDSIFEESVSILKKLISIDTVNPPGNEISLKSIIKDAFEDIGTSLKIIESKKGRANFIGTIGTGSPSIGFFPHLDTVPAGDGWKTDPFTPVVKDGKLYGRGSIDSKGNFASSWAAIKSFLTKHNKFKGTIYLVGCADEEMGSELGVKFLLKKGFKCDYAIVPDGGYIDKIIIGEKGALGIRIKSFGVQAHGSTPDKGINAVENLIRFLHKVMEMPIDDITFHESFTAVTRSINTIKGGHAPNVVPAYSEAEIDMRIPYGADTKIIIERINKHKKEIEKKFRGKFDIETIIKEPHLTNAKSPLIKAFLLSAKDFGVKMRVGTMGGITDAKLLFLAGADILVHSPDDGSHSAHNANEYVDLENLRLAASLCCSTLEKILL